MADIQTKRITRDQIAQAIGGNPRLVKLIEALTVDVGQTLPNNIDQTMLSTLFSLHGADGSKGAAQHAEHLAADIQALVSACQRQAADLQTLRDQIDLLRVELHDARAHLSSAIQQARAAAESAITLVSGV